MASSVCSANRHGEGHEESIKRRRTAIALKRESGCLSDLVEAQVVIAVEVTEEFSLVKKGGSRVDGSRHSMSPCIIRVPVVADQRTPAGCRQQVLGTLERIRGRRARSNEPGTDVEHPRLHHAAYQRK